jgi:hypothetical protein
LAVNAIDYSLTCFNASAARVAYLAIDGPDLQRRSAFAQCPSLSGHATLRKIIEVQRQSKLIINIFPQTLGVGLT